MYWVVYWVLHVLGETDQLGLDRLLERLGAAAGQQVGIDAQAAQHRHTVLRRLCLLLPNHTQDWNQADMHAAEIACPHPELKLPATSPHKLAFAGSSVVYVLCDLYADCHSAIAGPYRLQQLLVPHVAMQQRDTQVQAQLETAGLLCLQCKAATCFRLLFRHHLAQPGISKPAAGLFNQLPHRMSD